jgi:hypothetical protein
MRKSPYYKRAAKQFLLGSKFRTPCEAVEAGVRSLEEWSNLLLEERELDRGIEHRDPRQQRAASRSAAA